MARPRNGPCPCGSGRQLKRCCLRVHRGARAETPEALMRSRYCAYVLGDSEYVIATTDPEGPQWQLDRDAWVASIQRFCTSTRFEGLTIRAVSPVVDGRGEVTFLARLRRDGEDVSFVERSEFVQRDGRWLYVGPLPLDGA